jgi:hypothetical protein
VVSVHCYDASRGLIGHQVDEVHGTEVHLVADGSRLAIQDGSVLQLHRWSEHDGHLRQERCIAVKNKVQTAQLNRSTLAFAAGDEVKAFDLASGREWQLASCPGLRSVMWPGVVSPRRSLIRLT